ncbi:MAG: cytochrome c4 [Legionella sp.]|nr:MAG: cytochrome c4 [Legionella sp.]
MKKLALAFILCWSFTSYAEETTQTPANKATVCTACHGVEGISPQPIWPNLAGQHPTYFVKQLKDIKIGKLRNVPTMTGIVASLTDQDMLELANYYAMMPRAKGVTPKKYLKRGEQLYRGGDLTKHITACIACHGPKGTGNAEAGFPIISGQHSEYLVLQLQAYKDGKRNNDLNHIMHDISKRMDQDDMEAVAHYIEGLY